MAAQQRAPQVITVTRTGDVMELPYRRGMTLEDAIRGAGFRPDQANEIRVGNKPVRKMSRQMKAGEQVVLLGQIRGA